MNTMNTVLHLEQLDLAVGHSHGQLRKLLEKGRVTKRHHHTLWPRQQPRPKQAHTVLWACSANLFVGLCADLAASHLEFPHALPRVHHTGHRTVGCVRRAVPPHPWQALQVLRQLHTHMVLGFLCCTHCEQHTCGNCLASTSGGCPTSPHVKQCSLKSLRVVR